MSAQLAPVDRVDRIVPPVQDRSEQRRREDRPPVPKRDEPRPAPPPEHKPDDEDDDHTIDLLVRGRWLPTGQILPGCSGAAPAS